MSHKRLFVVLLLVCTVSLLVYSRNFFSWKQDTVHFGVLHLTTQAPFVQQKQQNTTQQQQQERHHHHHHQQQQQQQPQQQQQQPEQQQQPQQKQQLPQQQKQQQLQQPQQQQQQEQQKQQQQQPQQQKQQQLQQPEQQKQQQQQPEQQKQQQQQPEQQKQQQLQQPQQQQQQPEQQKQQQQQPQQQLQQPQQQKQQQQPEQQKQQQPQQQKQQQQPEQQKQQQQQPQQQKQQQQPEQQKQQQQQPPQQQKQQPEQQKQQQQPQQQKQQQQPEQQKQQQQPQQQQKQQQQLQQQQQKQLQQPQQQQKQQQQQQQQQKQLQQPQQQKQQQLQQPQQQLQPKHTNIVFLKTHKTASTTIQNMLFRFAEHNNLTVALPTRSCGHQFCYPLSFSTKFVYPQTQPPNIITSHMRFNRYALQSLMPDNTIYITILREPASMFESLFSYYGNHSEAFRRVPQGSLKAFLADPFRYYLPQERRSVYVHNTLTFDLGGNKDRPRGDVAYAKAFVAKVERDFSLVMISEYFDESLVLLRHLLSWDLEDILYVKLNMRTESSKKSVSSGLSEKIYAWNSIDAYLYNYFNASFWVKLSELGLDNVAKEVDLLRQAQEKLMKSCFGEQMQLQRSASEIKRKDLRPWEPSKQVSIVGYDLPSNIGKKTKELCLKYIMPEITYTTRLLYYQLLRQKLSSTKTL